MTSRIFCICRRLKDNYKLIYPFIGGSLADDLLELEVWKTRMHLLISFTKKVLLLCKSLTSYNMCMSIVSNFRDKRKVDEEQFFIKEMNAYLQ